MNILITGVAGFIGFNLAKNLLKKNNIYGIDNFDDYYSIKIKKKRVDNLKKDKKFHFENIDIRNFKLLKKYITNKKIDIVIHLAAQAGVRYSLIYPNKYLDVNINGFINILKSISNKKIKKFIYASSSSVYGDSKNFPLKENLKLKPKNIYGETKKINELIADQYSKIYKTKFIGLRFFTIYGEWGRPDMFLFKLFKAFKTNKKFYLNNYGNHLRDFTYIGDVVEIINKLLIKKSYNHEIFNICSNKPINILDIVNNFKKNKKITIKMVKINKADVLKTHGSNLKIKKKLSLKKFSSFEKNFDNILNWYLKSGFYKL